MADSRNTIDTLLLLALPASGKSEVRKYLSTLSPEQCGNEFHMGPTVQLDDFPYVHFMRRIDEELTELGEATLFFPNTEQPFKDGVEWGTLIHLLNEDYRDLVENVLEKPDSAAQHLFTRLERCRAASGGEAKISLLSDGVRQQVAERLEKEARELLQAKEDEIPDTLKGKTIVIEFARGGPDGASMPLPGHYGYQYAFSQLSEEILKRSAILYIWVTPEESRRKNEARTDPDDPGSILHHGVPIAVLMNEYGCDDMAYLIEQSEKKGTVCVKKGDSTYHIPFTQFDNRVDKTSFVRDEQEDWKKEDHDALHNGLKEALQKLVS